MAQFLASLQFSYAAILPAFAFVVLGLVLRRIGWLSDYWVERGSHLMFHWGLPLMLGLAAARAPLRESVTATYFIVGIVVLTLTAPLAYWYAGWRGYVREHQGLFSQAAFRPNMGIIGTVLCLNTFGDEGLALAAVPLAFWTITVNILAVLVLNASLSKQASVQKALLGIFKNPLIIGISIGLLFSLSGLPVPEVVPMAGQWVSALVLPIALICVGGGISFSAMRASRAELIESCLWRLLLVPAVATAVGYLLGASGPALGVLYLMTASPAATAGFVMVVALGGDRQLSANIIVLTTILAPLSLTAGLTVLRLLGWV